TIGFFAPHQRYGSATSAHGHVAEFKAMVKALHQAGIEVILDVVYNHTAEGAELGPTLSFRGIDNAAYYRLADDDPSVYLDYTGCGNSLNVRHPHTLQLIMDSLRYWIDEMHVDGFRFDLASALARELHDVDRLSAFFDLVQQDPLVSQVKLIAEPWDVGEGGYQVGRFPPLWTEWNGQYRDTVRDYWRGEPGRLPELASRLTGSSDLYETSARRPVASVNFVTCHDGFTLTDLVSYDGKHNEANGERNRDGSDDNRSWNCGTEGPSDDPEINTLRQRQIRNFLTTLFFSQGIPMLLAGDELGRTQLGNNNTYCQDNEISWVDWDAAVKHADLIDFVAALSALRKAHPVLRRRRFFSGRAGDSADGQRDIVWLTPSGAEMTGADWNSGYAKALAVYVNGDAITEPGPRGERITDEDFVLLINAHSDPVTFAVPPHLGSAGASWQVVVDTGPAQAVVVAPGQPAAAGAAAAADGSALRVEVESRAMVVLRGARR
ncbi:MAG TPA: glycogen debranching protein GlgX, partial [Streptosporangiaceae bacterium]